MKYSTLKKTVALSVASLMAVGVANAQTMTKDTTASMSSGMTTPKVFGGLGQYKSFSLGVNAGVTSQTLATGGSNYFHNKELDLGLGISLRQMFSHTFGLQLDVTAGHVGANDFGYSTSSTNTINGQPNNYDPGHYDTKFFQPSLSAYFNFANISWLHRKYGVDFYFKTGAGLAFYQPSGVNVDGSPFNFKNYPNTSTPGYITNHWIKELVIPVGVGAKFKLADAWALNIGYTENFIDGTNFDGQKGFYPQKDHYSYGYGGIEYTFGSKSKPNIDWVNPVALMYDELYDEALRQEVAALKGRVTNVENAVNDLKKDSDGDGVSDQFDKCPNTPAGTVVDGAGCPIVFPKPDTSNMVGMAHGVAYANIQFEFDSSVLKTSSYPVLDATSADLRTNSGKTVELAGYASSEGTAAHNLRLSRDRANSVKTYLVNSGVDAKRLKVKAYGETHPIADNSTEAGRILNRRVEFKQR